MAAITEGRYKEALSVLSYLLDYPHLLCFLDVCTIPTLARNQSTITARAVPQHTMSCIAEFVEFMTDTC